MNVQIQPKAALDSFGFVEHWDGGVNEIKPDRQGTLCQHISKDKQPEATYEVT